MSSYGIHYSLLSGHIYAGQLAKSGVTYASKEDLTLPAVLAVVEWVERQHNGDVVLSSEPNTGDGPLYRITVERLDPGLPGELQEGREQ